MTRTDPDRHRRAEQALWAAHGARPSERWCRLERLGVTVRVQELGAGPAVVFVHGASNAATSWASLASRLDGFRCLLVDRPGCGLSAPLDRSLDAVRDLETFADTFAVDVLDALTLPRAHLVATSFGGYLALRAVAASSDRFARLVLLGWSFGAPTTSTPLPMRIAMQPALGRVMTRIRPNERMVRRLLPRIGLGGAVESGRFGEVELAWFCSLLRDTATMRNEIDALPRVLTLRGVNPDTLLSDGVLGRVTVPTALIWGGDDPLGDAGIARDFAARLPDATLDLLPGAGHAPWIDEPDHVAAAVSRFLSD